MKLPPFDYLSPTSLAEATQILAAAEGSARPLAGGQSLMPLMAFRLTMPSVLVDLARIPDLDRITIDDDHVQLGARVRWRDIEADKRLTKALPLLAAAIEHVLYGKALEPVVVDQIRGPAIGGSAIVNSL